MSDVYARAYRDREWSTEDELELQARDADERATDARIASERVLLVGEDVYDDVDGPRTGSSWLRDLEDQGVEL